YVYQNGNPIETGKANDCYILGSGNDLYIVNNNPTKDMMFLVGGTDTTKQRMRIRYNGNVTIGYSAYTSYKLAVNGSIYATQYWQPSDIRLKHDIQPLDNTLDKIMKLRGVSFVYNNDNTGKRQIGFIAQEMEELFPEFITTDDNGLKGVSYANVSAVLLEGIKEQQKQIDGLNARLLALEKKSGVIQTSGFVPEGSNTGLWFFLSAVALSIAGVIIRKNR
ncbi:MAG: tail fiber domain-containing protein, partial [Ignavibacteriae bacterium]|nr:tail fiber domain-containing protein [Ignavibacteriota bacterium]